MEIESILLKQRDFFATQQTKSLAFRKMYLEKLKNLIISNENRLYEAINKILENQNLILSLQNYLLF